jgi:hypothetical protein
MSSICILGSWEYTGRLPMLKKEIKEEFAGRGCSLFLPISPIGK